MAFFMLRKFKLLVTEPEMSSTTDIGVVHPGGIPTDDDDDAATAANNKNNVNFMGARPLILAYSG